MATKKCGFWKSSHRFAKKTKPVRPGTYQKTCSRCRRVYNFHCGGFFSPHQWRKNRRKKRVVEIKCRRCTEIKGGTK